MLKQTFYTLSEIAPKTPYSAEYLSLLARRGKLRAVKMDAAWMTTKDWVDEYQQSIAVTEPVSGVSAVGGFLSVSEAAEGTPYGSEYLALRIRQGKLRGEKINGRWHTKREWIEEYVAGISKFQFPDSGTFPAAVLHSGSGRTRRIITKALSAFGLQHDGTAAVRRRRPLLSLRGRVLRTAAIP